jgi:2-polyprenyl-6-methoxyphenol hydroxylase-like FAD-dependent oxidoreductase
VVGPDGPVPLFAEYVVGCDGETSRVRELGGFTFPAAEPTRELLRADVTGIDVAPRRFERLERGVAIAATREGVTRVMVHEFDRLAGGRAQPPTFTEVAAVWAAVTGEDISAGTPVWVDAFDNASAQVTEYRRGRLLLAGDAAHRHLPVGGQALNVGLQDAVNLGWKLAGEVRGWAHPALLDSYHAERHPVSAAILDLVIAQELLLFGRREVEPARAVLAELLAMPQAHAHVANLVSGVGIRYGESEHPLVGTRLHPGAPGPGAGLLGDGRGMVLDRSTHGRPADTEAAAAWYSRVRVVKAPACATGGADLVASGGADPVLVRPDGHIAWVRGGGPSLREALTRWFGPLTR